MSVIWSGVTEEGAVVPVQVTAEGKVVAVGDGPEGDYLPITGGNLTGDLTLGTDKITLNAADGSASFAGYVGCNKLFSGGGQFITTVENTFQLRALYNDDCNFTVNNRAAYFGGSQSFSGAGSNAQINADGSASFAGDVLSTSTGASFLAANSSTVTTSDTYAYTTQGQIVVQRQDNLGCYVGSKAGTITSQINADGSATFAGGACGFTSSGEIFFTSRGTTYKIFVSQGLVQAEEYTRQMQLKEKAEQLIADKRETKPSDPQPEVTPDNDNA